MSILDPTEEAPLLRLHKALQHAPLFAELDAKSLAAVESQLQLLALPGGVPLFRRGEAADAAADDGDRRAIGQWVVAVRRLGGFPPPRACLEARGGNGMKVGH